MQRYCLLFFICCLFLQSCKTSPVNTIADEPGKRLFPSLLKPFLTESKDTLYEGSYTVYENRKQMGRKIALHILIVPSKSNDDLRSPIFYFQGGPGDAATEMVDYFLAHEIYRQNRDIVIDIFGKSFDRKVQVVNSCQQIES